MPLLHRLPDLRIPSRALSLDPAGIQPPFRSSPPEWNLLSSAIGIGPSSARIVATSQTSTPGPGGGTFGQSVPVLGRDDFVTAGVSRPIVGVREDPAVRTNLVLANATLNAAEVDVTLLSDSGASLGTKRYSLPPLEMTQVGRLVRELGFTADVPSARLLIATPTAGGAVAVYASAIDNVTNDPRTLQAR